MWIEDDVYDKQHVIGGLLSRTIHIDLTPTVVHFMELNDIITKNWSQIIPSNSNFLRKFSVFTSKENSLKNISSKFRLNRNINQERYKKYVFSMVFSTIFLCHIDTNDQKSKNLL